MNSRLEEAMRATRYTQDQPQKPQDFTGRAFEQPIVRFEDEAKPITPRSGQVPSHLQPTVDNQNAADELEKARARDRVSRALKRGKLVRETTLEDFDGDLMDPSEPGPPSREGPVGPDKYPLTYRHGGDEDNEFGTEDDTPGE